MYRYDEFDHQFVRERTEQFRDQTARRLAKQMGPGHTIVTVLCDYGTRYASKMFNPAFLREKGLPVPAWLEAKPDVPTVFEVVPA